MSPHAHTPPTGALKTSDLVCGRALPWWGLALKLFLVPMLFLGVLVAFKELSWPHGQLATNLTYEQALSAADDDTRPSHERSAAQLRAFLMIQQGKALLLKNSQRPGELGAEAEALLEKLRR